jgi:hypothetical protein
MRDQQPDIVTLHVTKPGAAAAVQQYRYGFLTEIPTDGSSKLAAFPDSAAGRCGPLRERDHRPIFYVSDVDVLYSRLVAPDSSPTSPRVTPSGANASST